MHGRNATPMANTIRMLNPKGIFRPRSGRTANPPATGQILFISALTMGIIGAGVAYSLTREDPRKKSSSPAGCAPYSFSEQDVRDEAETLLTLGDQDPNAIAKEVATKLYGKHPTGPNVVFPPGKDALAGVQCVWDKTLEIVTAMFNEKGQDPKPDDLPDDAIIFDTIDPYDAGYPWERAALHPENYPTPGLFFDVGSPAAGESLSSPSTIARYYLGSAIAMAAARGFNVTEAQKLVKSSNTTSKAIAFRNQALRLIMCSPYNDALYGTTDLWEGGSSYANQSNGRTIKFFPRHLDNIGRMKAGQPPKRGIELNGQKISNLTGNIAMPQLYLPAINLQLLAGNNPVVTTNGLEWSDGTATILPPPEVQKIGLDLSGRSVGQPGCAGVV